MHEEQAPNGVDVAVPSTARIYDYLLGGKDNFASDRMVAEQVIEAFPQTRDVALTNRRFLVRAVRHLAAEAGVRRFLDIGPGLPTQRNVHEVALAEQPDAQIVYVDNDPIVLVHARALLAGSNAVIVGGDLRTPDGILAAPEVRALIDAGEPVALLLLAILHFVGGEDDPFPMVKALVDALPSGSYLVLSHCSVDAHAGEDANDSVRDAYKQGGSPLYWRSRAEVASFFDGLNLITPGLVWQEDWRPDTPETPLAVFLAAIGRKP